MHVIKYSCRTEIPVVTRNNVLWSEGNLLIESTLGRIEEE